MTFIPESKHRESAKREYFYPKKEIISLPNLVDIQRKSFESFLSGGIGELISEVNPIEDYTGRGWELYFSNPKVDKAKYTVEDAIKNGLTYSAPWHLTATLKAKQPSHLKKKGKSITQDIYMGDLPLMTDKGTFIINGIERVVVNQLLRSEGVYFSGEVDRTTNLRLSSAKILPKNGAWLEFDTSKSDILTVKINRHRKIAATALLRLFGLTDNKEIMETFSTVNTDPNRNYILATLEKDPTENYDEATMEVFRKVRPGEPVVLDNARAVVEGMFFSTRRYSLGKVGRFKMNQVLGLKVDENQLLLTKEDLVGVISKIIGLNNSIGEYTDVDHLGNRRVRTVGELVQSQMRIGFLQMERNIKERMSLQPREELCQPGVLISPRPIEARLHAFFASGQLSQYHDQINLLSGLDHLRRLAVTGPGGLTKERASFSVRDAHYTHYGKICPVRTPEGPNIGLVTYLALYVRVNENGFLETPYRKIVKDEKGKAKVTAEVQYRAAYDEDNCFITDSSVKVAEDGTILEPRIPLRHRGEFFIGPAKQADFMDIVPRQVVGVSAALIPFLAHDDPNRALMASNMQTQAVPLLLPKAPLVGTGIEEDLAGNSGACIYAEEDGLVDDVDASTIKIRGKSGKSYEYHLQKFVRSNNDTNFHQKPAVDLNQKVQEGDLLADGPSIETGELALGTNLRVAYMSWYGYGYEDAIIISDRLVKEDVLSSVHISEYSVPVLETKLGPEEVTRDIPNVSEESLRNLDEGGIVYIGAKVKAGDILVGKVAPKGETELTAEERLLRAIFGEKAREVRDNSLKVPHGEYGTVISIKTITKKDNEDLPAGVIKEISVRVAQIRKVMVGDKLAGRHGNKGVISKILPIEDMPHLPDGAPIDIIISPVNVIGRMNVGQLLETQLGWAARELNKKYAVPVFSQFKEDSLIEEIKRAELPLSGKTLLIDGRTGEEFDREILIGDAYILKLIHLAEDKIHARSTGPYSLITQQPLGGKAQFGGQRFGEMEVWALEAYSAAHTLQEMLTIKSDDLVGRTLAYRAIVQGQPVPEATIPESFKLLVRELNGLALDIEVIGEEGEVVTKSEKEKVETKIQAGEIARG